MKNRCISTIGLIITVSIIFSGCHGLDDYPDNNQYSYSLIIETPYNINYTIYAPIPTSHDSYKQMEKLIDKLWFVNGSGTISLFWTEFGAAVKIQSNGPFFVQSDVSNNDDYERLGLSMESEQISANVEKHWFYYKCDIEGEFEISITVNFHGNAGECCAESITEKTEPTLQTLNNTGWQHIRTEYKIRV